MIPDRNLTGKRFGRLTVLEVSYKKNGIYYWKVLCDCGNSKDVSRNNLVGGSTKSCGCLKRKPTTLVRNIIRRYKRQSAERGLKWDLTEARVQQLIERRCIYCGEYPANTDTATKRKYNGIDRFDNTKGYTRQNSVTCCHPCNRAKSDMKHADFLRWIDKVYHFSILRKETL